MEEDLKISEMEYLSNQLLHIPNILKLISGGQPKIKNNLQWKTTLKNNEKYLSNYWSYCIWLKF